MLTVQHIPPKNQFFTVIGSLYDKNSCQNELQPITTLGFTWDYLGVDYFVEGLHRITNISAVFEIIYYSSATFGDEIRFPLNIFKSTSTGIINAILDSFNSNKFLLLLCKL